MIRSSFFFALLLLPICALAQGPSDDFIAAVANLETYSESGASPDVPTVCEALAMACPEALMVPAVASPSLSTVGADFAVLGTMRIAGINAFVVTALIRADHRVRGLKFQPVAGYCSPTRPLVAAFHLPAAPAMAGAPPSLPFSAPARPESPKLIPIDTFGMNVGAFAITVVRQQTTRDCAKEVDADYFVAPKVMPAAE